MAKEQDASNTEQELFANPAYVGFFTPFPEVNLVPVRPRNRVEVDDEGSGEIDKRRGKLGALIVRVARRLVFEP